MDFRFTKEEEEFREEVRQFLREEPPENFRCEVGLRYLGSGKPKVWPRPSRHGTRQPNGSEYALPLGTVGE